MGELKKDFLNDGSVVGKNNSNEIQGNRKIMDSVFTDMFRQKEYLIELYRTLHPEDNSVEEDDLEIITLENVLAIGEYNDLGFMVKNKLIILVEAQTKWSENILIRMLLYVARTYNQYKSEHSLDLYSTKKVTIPEPELYVLYTGGRKERPEQISLSEAFFGGKETALNLKIKVLYGGSEEDNIVDQYVAFTKVYKEQLTLYRTDYKTAIRNTVRLCITKNILRRYLESREKEVIDMLTSLFDYDEIMRIHDINVKKSSAENIAQNMLRKNKYDIDEIVQLTGLSVEEVRELAAGQLETV